MKRFEKKILLSLLLAVTIPLIASVLLVSKVMDSVYSVGMNSEIETTLVQNQDTYRTLFKTWKKYFQCRTELLAKKYPHIQVQFDDPYIKEIKLVDSSNHEHVLFHRSFSEKVRSSYHKVKVGKNLNQFLQVEYVVPWSWFNNFAKLGNITTTYHTLRTGWSFLKVRYVLVYVSMIIIVIIFSFVVGYLHSRRVTHRIGMLANATKQIAKGDLNVTLEPSGDDEIEDLIKLFNKMIVELKENRERIKKNLKKAKMDIKKAKNLLERY